MKAFGISALVIAIVAIFIPLAGPFVAGVSGVLAFFSAGKGTVFGLSAVIINIVNIWLLSPSLILAAAHESSNTTSSQFSIALISLLLIQIVAVGIFVVKRLISSDHQASA